MNEKPEFVTLAEEILALQNLSPIERARTATELILTAQTTLSLTRRQAIYQATRKMSYAEAAGRLNITTATINEAVSSYLKTLREASDGQ